MEKRPKLEKPQVQNESAKIAVSPETAIKALRASISDSEKAPAENEAPNSPERKVYHVVYESLSLAGPVQEALIGTLNTGLQLKIDRKSVV